MARNTLHSNSAPKTKERAMAGLDEDFNIIHGHLYGTFRTILLGFLLLALSACSERADRPDASNLERLTNQTIAFYLQDAAIEEFTDNIIKNIPAYRGKKDDGRKLYRKVIQSKTFRQGLQNIWAKSFSPQDIEDLVVINEIGERKKSLQEKMMLIHQQEGDFLGKLLMTPSVFEKASTVHYNDMLAQDHLTNKIMALRLQEGTVNKMAQAIMHSVPEFSSSERKAKEHYYAIIQSETYREGLNKILTTLLSHQEIDEMWRLMEIEIRNGGLESLDKKNRAVLADISALMAKIVNAEMKKEEKQ